MKLNNKIFIKILILIVLTIVVNADTEGATRIENALEVVKKYQECIREAKWLDQSKLIIEKDLNEFKNKLVSIPTFKALEEMTSNELYAHIFGRMMNNTKIDKLEIIDSIQENNETIHIIVKDTMIVQDVKKSNVRMLTVKFINNEWKISGAERLNKTANAMHLQILKSGTKKLRTQMLKLGKAMSQISKMEKTEIQKSVTQKPKKENTETQKN